MQNYQNSGVKNRVYLDHNATTPHSSILKSRWMELASISGNPSSIHQDSRVSKTILRETRKKLADFLGCSSLEIIFTSGASEGNNAVLKSVFSLLKESRNEFIISHVEHPSVLKTVEALREWGATVHLVPVNRDGILDINFVKEKLSEKTALVSVMYANNETGSVFPISEISRLAHAAGALVHSDCVQMLGKSVVDFKSLDVDYATFSAHKFYSMKGTGFVYVKKSSPWIPLIHGGGQERSRRGGTENITGIAALNIVLDELKSYESKISEVKKMRDDMEAQILEKISDVSITAVVGTRLANTSSLVIKGVDGETLLMSLDLKGFSVSTGAACSSGNPEPSPVLLSMGLSRQEAQNSLRVSLGWENTREEIQSFVNCLIETVEKLRAIEDEERKRDYAG